jgi:hypothetical protein
LTAACVWHEDERCWEILGRDQVTRGEKHSTRGRARLLFEMRVELELVEGRWLIGAPLDPAA